MIVDRDTKSAIIALTHGEELCIVGKTKLRTLRGSVTVLGFDICSNSSEQYFEVFSPNSISYLTIKENGKNYNSSVSYTSKITDAARVEEVSSLLENCDWSSVVQLVELNSPCLSFISSFSPFQQLFVNSRLKTIKESRCVGIDIVDDEYANKFKVTEDYEYIKEKILGYIDKGKSIECILLP